VFPDGDAVAHCRDGSCETLMVALCMLRLNEVSLGPSTASLRIVLSINDPRGACISPGMSIHQSPAEGTAVVTANPAMSSGMGR
jgi:hypothetical protein